MALSGITWPPPYKLRKHRLARHVRLRTSKQHGLEITVPYRFNAKEIPAILAEHKVWIVEQLQQLQTPVALPSQLALSAIGECWPVFYEPCEKRLSLLCRPQRELVLIGRQDEAACKEKLIAWVKDYARERLTQQLDAVSAMTGLHYQSVTLRDQRTMWGSCTAYKSINLNYKLIFLPPLLAKHVMIHELCHTMHLNHSKRFWALVASFDPDWQLHRRALRRADTLMPAWV